jgi:hypothetical protein
LILKRARVETGLSTSDTIRVIEPVVTVLEEVKTYPTPKYIPYVRFMQFVWIGTVLVNTDVDFLILTRLFVPLLTTQAKSGLITQLCGFAFDLKYINGKKYTINNKVEY